MLLLSWSAFATEEETFGSLQVGENTYQNVRVTTKAKDYILIVHSSGITSIKVKQLPEDIRERLGYVPVSTPKDRASAAVKGLTQPVANGAKACVEQVRAGLSQAWHIAGITSRMQALKTRKVVVIVAAALLLMAHVFCSYCCVLICRKAGKEPGILAWIPLLQTVPLLRAASMSTWWFGAGFVPGLNLVGYVRWCVRIVEARQKTMPLAILLIFPLTTWFAFMVLAFSEDAREREKVRVVSMSLETASTSGSRSWVNALSQGERHIAA
jgi:hypothetical protein